MGDLSMGCQHCAGSGYDPDDRTEPCPRCNGTGMQ